MKPTKHFSSMNDFIESVDINKLLFRLDIGAPRFTLAEVFGSDVEDLHHVSLDYGASSGLKILRELLAEKIKFENGLDVSADNVLITDGAAPAIYTVLSSILKSGDSVLIPTPAWPSYEKYVTLLRCKVVLCEIDFMQPDISLPIDILDYYRKANNIKVLIINSPHNPTGKIFSQENLYEIMEYCIKHNIFIVIDEAYYGVVYKHIESPYLNNPNIFYVRSFSKYYLLPGIRLGYIFGNAKAISQIGTLFNVLHGKTSTLSQHIGVKLLQQSKTIFQAQIQKYNNNIAAFRRIYSLNTNLLEMVEPTGTFFIFCRIKPKIAMDHFITRLINNYGTMIIPGNMFSSQIIDYIRISLTEKEDKIYEGFERLISCIGDYVD